MLKKIKLSLLILGVSVFYNQAAFSQEEIIDNKKADHSFEIRVAPLALLFQWLGIEAAYPINDHMDAGINFLYYGDNVDYGKGNMFFPTYEGLSYGLNINYYFKNLNESEDTWYTSLKINYNDFKTIGHASSSIFEYTGLSLIAVGGYRTPINIVSRKFYFLMGLGIQGSFYDEEESELSGTTVTVTKKDQNDVTPYLEFKVAYQF